MADRLLLGLDNSMDFLNLALAEGGRLVEERHTRMEHHSSGVLPVRVASLLEDHGYTVGDLSGIVITLGPGSFTGVRVALAFCKGLSEGLGIPLSGVPTPDVLASPFAFLEEGHHLCPLIDAKKGEAFFAVYRVENGRVVRTGDIRAAKPREIRSYVPAPCLCFGTGVRLCADALAGIDGLRLIAGRFERVS
jgi:tRNA threonylcarbamoyladenosine biosynthesis protein TsaB